MAITTAANGPICCNKAVHRLNPAHGQLGQVHPWQSCWFGVEENEFSDPDFLASLAEFIGSRTGPATLMLLAEILKDCAEEKLAGLSHDQQFLKRIGMRW